MEAGTGPETPKPDEGGGASSNVQKAIDDLTSAASNASDDVRANIDSAVKRLRDVSGSAASQARDTLGDWQKALESAAEDARREMAKLAVKAQGSAEALDDIEKEVISKREQLRGPSE